MTDRLKTEISAYLGNSHDIFFYRKGRVALYALLKAIGIGQGDEVIIQAFTCVVVASAVKYLGAKPVYVDILPDCYNMDIRKIEHAITSNTRAIICQNTFGLSTGLEEIIELSRKHGLYTIEDCAHGFGGTFHGKPNGLFCDASFFSMQWNKPFSSGLGGFAVVKNNELISRLSVLENEKLTPGILDGVVLRLLFFVRRQILSDNNYWLLLRLYRWMSKNNLVIGSSSGDELNGTQMPSKYFMDYSSIQAREGMKNILEFASMAKLRKENAAVYNNFLMSHNKTHVDNKFVKDHSFLKYPLIVNDRILFSNLAEKEKIRLGDWFISPLHPITEDLSRWDFDESQFPVAGHIAKHMVNLPTEVQDSNKVISFLERNLDMIM